ncbi:hypothetical protein [Lentzea cavernae]|uniref:Uncharacterized protein n=1 Tax=Lentzea cavernae TaxID=2020703 RepID=A0ABQ3LXS5_9PSEU|nr:hypothetical protein [Lentzea cavernae]GHH27982.1 hypothetical protein GCM10017774_01420 [Lentzea cavernae]
MGEPNDRNRRIDAWLAEEFGDASAVVLRTNQLVGLSLAAQRGAVPPDEVMQYWYHQIFSARIMAAQSEASFIDAARAKGWPDETIGEMLMVDPDRLDDHRDEQYSIHLKIHPAIRRQQC